MQVKKEILAPAGDEYMLKAAVMAGANAVYLGLLRFNARRNAGNFDLQNLIDAVKFCHARDVKVYVALNTIVMQGEMQELAHAIQNIANAGANAVIVQDLAVAALVKKMAPTLEIHGSTQMSVHSLEGALALKALGFSRVILSRELNISEIEYISKNCGIQTEVFVHGALCLCVSGQCYMSAFFGNRSANRGTCAGPCRLPFKANEQDDKSGEKKYEHDNFHLSLKDMSHIEKIHELFSAGVCSVKIEGRMRSAEYAALSVNACKSAIDGKSYDEDLLRDIFSRSGFTNAYLTGNLGKEMFGVRTKEQAALAKSAQPKIRELYRRELQAVPIEISLKLSENGAVLCAKDEQGNTAQNNLPLQLQKANNSQASAIEKALSKLGGTPFFLKKAYIEGDEYFLPSSQLNEMRRKAAEQLLLLRSEVQAHECAGASSEEISTLVYSQTLESKAPLRAEGKAHIPFSVFLSNVNQISEELLQEGISNFILPIEQFNDIPLEIRGKTYLSLPRFCAVPKQEQKIKELVLKVQNLQNGKFAGFYAQNIAHFNICKGSEIFAGFGLNITNALSVATYAGMGACKINASLELTLKQMENLKPSQKTLAQLAGENVNAPQISCIVYGHIPLMLTRACPLHNVLQCNNCNKSGYLNDRKGERLYVQCSAPANLGVRTIYNPVALYMGDRLHEVKADEAFALFTFESASEVISIVRNIKSGEKMSKKYTRGLYEKGVL